MPYVLIGWVSATIGGPGAGPASRNRAVTAIEQRIGRIIIDLVLASLASTLSKLSVAASFHECKAVISADDLPKAADDPSALSVLIDLSREQVDAAAKASGVPLNPLHEQGFPSIGCAPCTRAVKPSEDERAGRWWWEQDGKKECGLHVTEDGSIQPRVSLAEGDRPWAV